MSPFDGLVARLTARAAVLAEAEAERRRDHRWWRKARLVWPQFTDNTLTKG